MSSPNGAQAPTVHHAKLIPIGLIDPQPRDLQRFDDENPNLDDLAATLRQHGQLQAIVVRTTGDRFQLIIGSRRWRAARLLGWPQIRADILPEDTPNTTALTLTENLARRQLTPAEEAIGVAQLLKEHDNDPAPVAKALGRSIRWIEQRAALVLLPPVLLHALHARQIRIAHAEALARCPTETTLHNLLAITIDQTPPAHLVARWVDEARAAAPGDSAETNPSGPPPNAEPIQSPGVLCACCARTVPVRTATAISVCLICAEEIRTATQGPITPATPPTV